RAVTLHAHLVLADAPTERAVGRDRVFHELIAVGDPAPVDTIRALHHRHTVRLAKVTLAIDPERGEVRQPEHLHATTIPLHDPEQVAVQRHPVRTDELPGSAAAHAHVTHQLTRRGIVHADHVARLGGH